MSGIDWANLDRLKSGACDHDSDGNMIYPGMEHDGLNPAVVADLADRLVAGPRGIEEFYPEPCGPPDVDPVVDSWVVY